MYTKQVRWKIKSPFDGIFTQQYVYQKLLELDNTAVKKNYRRWLDGIRF